MKLYKDHFRKFWQKPRTAGIVIHSRQVTFLELFYDVVYVAIIAQLAHGLAYDMTGRGLFEFSFLFVIVWWGWFNGTIYHDLHGNNDLRTRVFTFLQMLAVVFMAIFADGAMKENSKGFAISYAIFQLIFAILWWRAAVHDKHSRALSKPYSLFFLISTILFAISPFVAENTMFRLWLSSIIVALSLPIYLLIASRKNLAMQSQVKLIIGVSPSLVERFGLFTIVVLGEIIIGWVNAVSDEELTFKLAFPIAIGTLIAIGIWRVYFDFISHRKPRKDIKSFALWYYLHLPLTIGISIIGATTLHIVEYINEPLPHVMQLIFCSGMAMFMLSSSALIPIITHTDNSERYYKVATRTLIFSALSMIGVAFININTINILLITILLLGLPFILSFRIWLLDVNSKGLMRH